MKRQELKVSKATQKKDWFVPRDFFIDNVSNRKWQGYLYNPATEVYDFASNVEKTKGEALRVTLRAIKRLQKADKDRANGALVDLTKTKDIKAKSKGISWNMKRHADIEKDELECTNCGNIKSFDDFYNTNNKIGKQNFCKDCIKEYQKKRRAALKTEAEAA